MRSHDATRATGAVLLSSAIMAGALLRRARRFDFKGRVVMITGGSRGLGISLAREVARRGARVVLVARTSEELRRATEELRARGADARAIPCDVRRRDEVQMAVTRAIDFFGSIDVLINDAGVIEVGPLEEMTEQDFTNGMATHFEGPLHLVQEIVPRMIAAGGGRIVNIASIGGLVPVPHLAPYCASKFALVGFSEALRVELAKDKVVVTTVCPGLMRTGSGGKVQIRGEVTAESEWFRAGALTPLLSMTAETAARRIADACARGDGRVVLGLPARVLATAYALSPGLVGRALSLVNRALPSSPPGPRRAPVRGDEVPLQPSWLQAMETRVAQAHNESPVPRGT